MDLEELAGQLRSSWSTVKKLGDDILLLQEQNVMLTEENRILKARLASLSESAEPDQI